MNISCPVCKKDAFVINDSLSKCSFCLHIFQTDLKCNCSYDADYLNTYMTHSTCDAMSATRAGMILGALSLPQGAKILDIGYANGAFLKAVQKMGYKTYGMDLHGQDMGIEDVTFDSPHVYDLVCFFDSLEHFENIEDIFKIQTKHAIVSIPMRPSFFPEKTSQWKHYKPGEHLHYFSPESLQFFMARWGLTKCISSGNPEDVVRGKLVVDDASYNNIYTAIFGR